ncbi:hypothetical protein B7P43_G03776, partial [Cryptotermes secundus]
GLTLRESLNKIFPNIWIGRDGPISSPPRSPDIIPMEFFFISCKINSEVASVTAQMLENTWLEIQYRSAILHATNGVHAQTSCWK